MENNTIYQDLATRTHGVLYIGVVGPVRTGKSTFIRQFATQFILPHVCEAEKGKLLDELPLSSTGKTIATTEPKFVPSDPVEVQTGQCKSKIRLIDCVGFPVEGAMGLEEDGKPRMVTVPWQSESVPFALAAREGTEKVIFEHANVAFLLTCDGTFGDIPQENFAAVEQEAVEKLNATGKPYLILVNSASPQGKAAIERKNFLQEKYGHAAYVINAQAMQEGDIEKLLGQLLLQFPVNGVSVCLPPWLNTLPADHAVISSIAENLRSASTNVQTMRDCSLLEEAFSSNPYLDGVESMALDLSCGKANITLAVKEQTFYQVVSDNCGEEISDKKRLLKMVTELSKQKQKYDKVACAFEKARQSGYGVVSALEGEVEYEPPKMNKQGGNVSLHLAACADTYHILKVKTYATANPVVGEEKRGEEFAQSLIDGYGADSKGVLDTQLFGKSLKDLLQDGLNGKSEGLSEPLQKKMRRTLGKIVNEGKGNFLCILL